MLQVLIIVCSADMSPADCEPRNAANVIAGPVVAHEMICGHWGQAYLADTLPAHGLDGRYVKIRCVRQKLPEEATKRKPSGADMSISRPLL